MPNHVTNYIKFYGDEKNIKSLFEAIKPDADSDQYGDVIDFEKIIPMPECIFRGNLGQAEREQYGCNNWYDWSIANWGTKWNAYDSSIDEFENSLCFFTAWSMPEPIIQKLGEMCKALSITFDGSWCDEDWSANSGRIGFLEDMDEVEFLWDDTVEEHRERARDLLGLEFDENGEIIWDV